MTIPGPSHVLPFCACYGFLIRVSIAEPKKRLLWNAQVWRIPRCDSKVRVSMKESLIAAQISSLASHCRNTRTFRVKCCYTARKKPQGEHVQRPKTELGAAVARISAASYLDPPMKLLFGVAMVFAQDIHYRAQKRNYMGRSR